MGYTFFPPPLILIVLSHFSYLHQEPFHSQPWASLTNPQHTQIVSATLTALHVGNKRQRERLALFSAYKWKPETGKMMKYLDSWQESSTIIFSSVFPHNFTAKLHSLISLWIVQFPYLDRAQMLPKKWNVQWSFNHHGMQTMLKLNMSLRSFKAPLPISPLWQFDLSSCLVMISHIPPYQLITGTCK